MDIIEEFLENMDASPPTNEEEIAAKKTPWYNEFKAESIEVYSNCIENFKDEAQLYSATDYAAAICTHYYKQAPCCVNTCEKYSLDLVDHLKANGRVVWRTVHQNTHEISRVFLYRGVFVTFVQLTYSKNISGLIIYHPIDVLVPLIELEKFKLPTETKAAQIGIIKSTKYGLRVDKIKLKNNQVFDTANYNEDFTTFFDVVKLKLSENKAGLFLLHGEPGTGKSSAIRYLITQVNRDFIFVPPQMVNHLSAPEFADIITDTNKGSVLVIEDAEKALMKRETEDGFSNSTLVSSILNITDGLYADIGNIAIIATYNCDRNLIDSALLRKGRMKAEYKFDKLSTDRAQALINKLGYDVEVTEPMSIADIFNYEDQYTNANKKREKSSIGFNRRPGF